VKSGIVIISELEGDVRERVHEIQRQVDPKLAASLPPHITITGSSGMGPISARTTEQELRAALEPIAAETPPMTLSFQRPIRFMQSQVVVLPLDPHGPLRALHERIKQSGLIGEQPRFAFTPHVTLNLFRELPADEVRELLKIRVKDPVTISRIAAFQTVNMVSTRKVIELELTGNDTRK
jgi:2'-5' RNA ligase